MNWNSPAADEVGARACQQQLAAREALEHDDSIARPLEKTDGLLDHHVILHGQHASTRATAEEACALE